ncbi:tetratricopeptide repeat protein [Parasediminibacterium sp. JCM 36343]|uniref:tetratricopeptide repeat protein n=1 Tax=Parasediminibacterium sp. JCM 36343 TaxID=3374279 RepID=UPI00397CF23A
MHARIKIFTSIVAFFSFTYTYSQATLITTDVDADYKLAKEYFAKEEYSLAYPIFKNINTTGVEKTNYPANIAIEGRYYYISCGLKLNDATMKSKAIEFIELEYNLPRVQMLCFDLAEYFFRANNFADAIAYYNKAGIDNLSNADIAQLKFHKAYAYFTLQQFQEAKPLFNAIRQIPSDSNYVDANYYYGFITFSEKNYKEALIAFKVAENEPSYAKVVPFYIAEIYYFNNDRDKALSYVEQLLKTNNQYYDLQLKQLAGKLYFDKRRFKEALPYLEEYVSKTPKVAREDLYQLSYCYYEAGSWENAIEGFKQLGGKEDSLAQNSMYLLADAYLKTNQKINARNAFLFCASNSSNATQQEISTFSYAKLSYELGYLDIALSELQKFIIKYPNSNNILEAKELLVGVLSNTSNYKEALALFESLKSQGEMVKKIYPKILYGRAVELINDQQIQQADVLLTRITKAPYNNQQIAYTWFWKGEIAYRTDLLDDAITYFASYLINPLNNGEINSTNARYSLAYCYLKKGDYKAAQKHFEQVANSLTASATPLRQDAYLRNADCYFMNKQYKQALKIYDDIYTHQLKTADYALYQKAVIAGAMNKRADKITLMQALVKEYPESPLAADANIELANSFLADEKYAEALAPLQQILNNKDASALWPRALLKTGVSYFNTDKNDEALASFTKLVKQYPNSQESDEAIEYIRNIFVENQKPNEFVSFMQQNGKPISTSEADSLTYRAALLRYEAKDFASAKIGFANYISKYPDGKNAIESNYFSAEMYITDKDANKALPFYNAVAAKAPNKYAERSALQSARIYYYNLKDYANAGKYFTQVKALATQQENKLEAMRGLLRCQYRLQQFKEGLANAKELLAQSSAATDDKMMASMIVAKSFQADNQLDSATAAYKNVTSLGKSEYSAEAQYRIAEILFLQNKLDLVEKAAFEVIKKEGSYEFWVTKSYILLGDLYLKQHDLFNAEATFKSVSENSTIADLKQEAASKLAQVIEEKNKTNKVETPQ